MVALLRSVATGLLLLSLSAQCHANASTAVALIPNGSKADYSLNLVGKAHFKVAFFSVFKSQLYTDSGYYHSDSRPLKLVLQYQRNIKAEQLIKQTQKEWLHLNINHDITQHWIHQLQAMWPDIKKYDTLSLIINQQGESEFLFNDQFIGKIVDPDFGKQFVAIWLSPNTSAPSHRQQLLKKQANN